jgi:DNA mismatch endonuclease, patch repair protein
MPDQFTKQQRSALMAKIKSRNTKFERNFIDLLKQTVFAPFTLHARTIRGSPDIVFERQKVCVFLDSDFWHGWQYPRWRGRLKNDYWRDKIAKTRKRDARTTAYLKSEGWKVIRVWEHQINANPRKVIEKIEVNLLETRASRLKEQSARNESKRRIPHTKRSPEA